MTVVSFPSSSPCLVVFGRDQAGKPHASWFDGASAELATKAAGLMGMRAVAVEGDELRELAGTLPRGRVFSSGKAFTPFVNGKLYGRLVELTRDLLGLSVVAAEGADLSAGQTEGGAGADEAGVAPTEGAAASAAAEFQPGAKTAGAGSGKRPPSSDAKSQGKPRPTTVAEIGLGSLVLANAEDEGWFEAEVIGVNGTMLTLRWRDYNEPTIIRRPGDLGFMPVLLG